VIICRRCFIIKASDSLLLLLIVLSSLLGYRRFQDDCWAVVALVVCDALVQDALTVDAHFFLNSDDLIQIRFLFISSFIIHITKIPNAHISVILRLNCLTTKHNMILHHVSVGCG
jgi:hypothetical protein